MDVIKNISNSIEDDNLFYKLEDNNDFYPEPTDLRVSTITAVAKTNTNINLKKMFECINEDNFISEDSQKEGIIKIKYGNIYKTKDYSPSDNVSPVNIKKMFYNQITIIILIKKDLFFKAVNLKIFNNGILQLTGLRKFKEGINCINLLIEFINNIEDKESFLSLKDNSSEIIFYDYEIVLINSDFSARFKIKRDILYEILVKNYNLYVSYEPCIYQGVNSKYYWNEDYKNFPNKGICYCRNICNGKGIGKGDGQCKKITIATFQSGKVIITGARSFEQISCAYNFINDVFKTNFDEIKRIIIPVDYNNISKNDEAGKIILLKKRNIVFNNKKIFN